MESGGVPVSRVVSLDLVTSGVVSVSRATMDHHSAAPHTSQISLNLAPNSENHYFAAHTSLNNIEHSTTNTSTTLTPPSHGQQPAHHPPPALDQQYHQESQNKYLTARSSVSSPLQLNQNGDDCHESNHLTPAGSINGNSVTSANQEELTGSRMGVTLALADDITPGPLSSISRYTSQCDNKQEPGSFEVVVMNTDHVVKTESSPVKQQQIPASVSFITNFEEAAVSLAGALRIVKNCEELLGKSNEEVINIKLCGKLRVAAESLTEASRVLENYISTHSDEFGQLEEVKFDMKNFLKADQEDDILKEKRGEKTKTETNNLDTDFKRYDMKIEAAEVSDEEEEEDVGEDNIDIHDAWENNLEGKDDPEEKSKMPKSKKKKYRCSECSYTAKKSSNLKTHVEAKHRNNMYSCNQCDFTTTTHAYLKVHKHKHTVISEKRHFCTQCNLSFNRNSRLQHHISVIHEGKRLNCSQCEYTCKYHSNLKEHINRIHKGIVYKCDACDYQTGSDKNLKVHIAASHEKGEYHCEQCEYTAQSKTRLQYHVNRVHKGKIFIRKKVTFFCDQCSASFSSQKLLDIHIEVKHGTQMFSCAECKYTTKSEFYLHRHVKKHRAQVLYCDQCDYSTQVKELFKVHQNKHTGVTFKCTYCQFESHSKFNLGQHVKKVHEKSSVACPKCSFVATAQVYLRRHIKKSHPEGTDQQQSQQQTQQPQINQQHHQHHPASSQQPPGVKSELVNLDHFKFSKFISE